MTGTKKQSAEANGQAREAQASEGAFEIRLGSPEVDLARDDFVRAHPGGTFFHLSGWRRMVERVYGHDPRELVAWEGDRMVGILPMMLCRSLRGRVNLVSMPYAVYGGALGADEKVEAELIARAQKLAKEEQVGYLEVRYPRESGLDWPKSELYCTFRRELPDEPDGVLAMMPKKARAEARKARKRHGLELAEGLWYTDDLCRLFLMNKYALGSPGLPAEHFRAILEELGENVHVHIVRKEREPLAAVMSFAFGETLIAYYAGTAAGSDRAFSASNFMYLALQEWAVEQGFRVFDFCRSRVDSGAFRFKKHQGFEPEPLHYHYFMVRDRAIPSFNPSNPKTQILRSTWSRLPLWMARRGSDRLARYLS